MDVNLPFSVNFPPALGDIFFTLAFYDGSIDNREKCA